MLQRQAYAWCQCNAPGRTYAPVKTEECTPQVTSESHPACRGVAKSDCLIPPMSTPGLAKLHDACAQSLQGQSLDHWEQHQDYCRSMRFPRTSLIAKSSGGNTSRGGITFLQVFLHSLSVPRRSKGTAVQRERVYDCMMLPRQSSSAWLGVG